MMSSNTKYLLIAGFAVLWVVGWGVYLAGRSDDCEQNGSVLVRKGFGIGWTCAKSD